MNDPSIAMVQTFMRDPADDDQPLQELRSLLQPVETSRDRGGAAAVPLNGTEQPDFDPFCGRQHSDHATTDAETLVRLLKASLGTGILAMPRAFMCAGLACGTLGTVFVSAVCTYCAYLLVKCAHALYRRTKVTSMGYADVAEAALANGPWWSKWSAAASRPLVLGMLFVTYFGTCSVYTVIIASNIQQVVSHHTGGHADVRAYVAALAVPLMLLSYVPNLKYLAPVSMAANGLMAVGLAVTFRYLLFDGPRPNGGAAVDGTPARLVAVSLRDTFPAFFCLTVFAMEAIGVVMPLENNMRTPERFLGPFGVLNVGMAGATVVYVLLGFFGYLKYGENVADNVTLNLPTADVEAQVAKICVALAVFCTYGIQFFVCLEIAWNEIRRRCSGASAAHNYLLRTTMVALSVALAVAVPEIGPFVGLIGALCFSLLGIIAPVVIEFVTFWDQVTVATASRNVFLITVGAMALVLGTANSIEDIVRAYRRQ